MQRDEEISGWALGRIYPTPDQVPEGWELVTLTDVAQLETGHTPSKDKSQYWNGDIPWVSLHDTKNLDGLRIDETQQTISPLGLANSSARLLPEGTVVFSRTATVGKATILGHEMATSQDFANYICGDQLHNEYLAHLFRFMKPEWERLMAGSTHNSIYMEVFRKLQILLPPLEEQKAIAEALSDVDALLASIDAAIKKKRNVKTATMQWLLTGEDRLPGFEGEWESKPLESCLADPPRYGVNAPAVPYNDSLPTYIRITDITEDGRYSPDSRVSVDVSDPEEYQLDQGDLVFARTGASVGKSYLYDESDGELVYAGFLIRIRPDPGKLHPEFLAYYAKTQRYWKWIRSMSMRSGQPGVNGKQYSQLPVPLPPIAEQRAIAEVLSDMDAEIETWEKRRAKTEAVKTGMMQELLTGKTRLL